MAEIKIPMYLTCKDGTRLTIPDDNTAIWNLGAPWDKIYLDSSLLSADAAKYVTHRPEPLTEAELSELIHSTYDDDECSHCGNINNIYERLNELESRIERLEHRPQSWDDAHFQK